MIKAAHIEVDGGYGDEPPYSTRAFLVLKGDFVDDFEKYINDENATTVSLRIDRDVAEKLQNSLTQVLYGS